MSEGKSESDFDFLVSGYGSSQNGTGRFLSYIEKIINKDTRLLYRFNYVKEIKGNLNKKRYKTMLTYAIRSSILFIQFYFIVFFLKNRKIIIFHPHSIGLWVFNRLLRRNRITLFVLDNSFFCMKSYNYRKEKNECLDCTTSFLNYAKDCHPYPFNYSIKKNLKTLRLIKKNSMRIEFLAQNQYQHRLLMKVYGDGISVKVLGMFTGEVTSESIPLQINRKENSKLIVYHGGLNEAKGIHYFIALAIRIPEYDFLIPDSEKNVKKYLRYDKFSDNLFFKKCSWESGLKDYVEESIITICPSMWSAPIEGALIKSLVHARSVAVVSTEFGFVNEIPGGVVLKLSSNPEEGTMLLRKFLKGKTQLHQTANLWIKEFLNSKKIELESFFNQV
jgi:hypothetical protein